MIRLILIVAILLAPAACGRKGDPVPPQPETETTSG